MNVESRDWLERAQRLGTTQQDALSRFDELDVVEVTEMFGLWKGSGLHTGHPLDGMLELYGWYGKRFRDAENVDPLLFGSHENELVAIDPRYMFIGMALALNLPRNSVAAGLFKRLRKVVSTNKPAARLRMMEFRGKTSASMIYDSQPINDVFRKVDDNTVLGLMDYRQLETPFFFVLRRAAHMAKDC